MQRAKATVSSQKDVRQGEAGKGVRSSSGPPRQPMYAKGMKPKNLLLIAIAALLGPWMLYSGAKEHQNGKIRSGATLLVCGCVLVVLRLQQRERTRQAAKKTAQSVEALCETHYEYAAVNAQDFGHLDLAWYGAGQRLLEERGFVLLGDEENLTFQRTSKGNRTLLRTMLGHDGTWLA